MLKEFEGLADIIANVNSLNTSLQELIITVLHALALPRKQDLWAGIVQNGKYGCLETFKAFVTENDDYSRISLLPLN